MTDTGAETICPIISTSTSWGQARAEAKALAGVAEKLEMEFQEAKENWVIMDSKTTSLIWTGPGTQPI